MCRSLVTSAALVLGAISFGGCCELTSLGWRRSIPAREHTVVRPVPSDLRAQVRAATAALDAATCVRICGPHEALGCEQTSDPVDAPDLDAVVTCHDRAGAYEVRVSGEAARRYFGPGIQPRERCVSTCVRPDAPPESCFVSAWGDQPVPGAPAVRCRWIEPGHCGP